MIKQIEKIDSESEGFKEFQRLVFDVTNNVYHITKVMLEGLPKDIGSEIDNLKEIDAQIKDLILNKLLIKIPDEFVYYVPVVTSGKVDYLMPQDFTRRFFERLVSLGITTYQDITSRTEMDFMKMPGMGKISMRELRKFMDKTRIKFKQERDN
jgi:DNA-directed RNA polymerase alpha subunit